MSEKDKSEAVAEQAESYYDSADADAFYYNIWGGEDIHIGLYESENESIRAASWRTQQRMAEQLEGLDARKRLLDIGAGYGGAARYLAKEYGCFVACLNISEIQNEKNREQNREQGLADKVEVAHGSFEDIPYGEDSFDVVWSQDAILHSGNRRRVLEEVRRVLRKGGDFVFTDPMQSDDCPPGVLKPILDRIHLDSLGSPKFYREELAQLGFEEVGFLNLTHQLRNHYARVREELESRAEAGQVPVSKEYVQRMMQGLQHWVDGADKGYLAWGIFHFRLV